MDVDTPLPTLTIPEIVFPNERIVFGPLGMKVWCPTGIEVSMTEEVERVNPPGWNLMMTKPPLDVAISDGVLPPKQIPLDPPQYPDDNQPDADPKDDVVPSDDPTDSNYDVFVDPDTGERTIKPKPIPENRPPPPPYNDDIDWVWDETKQTYIAEPKKREVEPTSPEDEGLPPKPDVLPSGATATSGDWIAVVDSGRVRWRWVQRPLPSPFAPANAEAWGAYIWRPPKQMRDKTTGQIRTTEPGHWAWFERAGRRDDPKDATKPKQIIFYDKEQNQYVVFENNIVPGVERGQRNSTDTLLPSQWGETLSRQALNYRDTLNVFDTFVYDLEKHLEDSGFDTQSTNVKDNALMFVDAALWGLEGGFLERDHPELATAWKISTFLVGWELGTVGAIAGKGAQLAGRAIASASRPLANVLVKAGQKAAQAGFTKVGQAAARAGSELLKRNASRLGLQLEQWGVLKMSDIATRGALASARKAIQQAPAAIRSTLRALPAQAQKLWWHLTENPQAMARLIQNAPSVKSKLMSFLTQARSAAGWKSMAQGLSSSVRKAIQSEWAKARELWTRAGRLVSMQERRTLQSQRSTLRGLQQSTRQMSRLRNRSALNSYYGLSSDASAAQRRGLSAREAIEKQIADEMNQLRYKRRQFTSFFGDQQIAEMRSSLLWD